MLKFNHEKLRAARRGKNYTLQDVADRLQIELHAYWRLEQGQTQLKVDQLLKLIHIFDKPLEYFLEETSTFHEVNDKITDLKILVKKLDHNELDIESFQKGIEMVETSLIPNLK
ncbi:hypothetical protein B5V89_17875 [Heyndrickxia sporothermodurans]|mgnify:CR=1 FL=1|uniref:helix-turn-helix domain-containing protein n=1 Tax=Bacillaceae TaxID=186817 RepID=UPI000D354F90|nr:MULTISPECIES: helix-turn-helix transcriptional regulator [Bacillaceae]PTY76505.1 hypothetical protein B5V89_17875 [Heyndrickxia sporothermodurans]